MDKGGRVHLLQSAVHTSLAVTSVIADGNLDAGELTFIYSLFKNITENIWSML
jgi:hypothetical protein